MNKKGLTDIIAIVLLLMITISMVGFAWMWLQRVSTNSLQSSSNQMDALSNKTSQILKVENVVKLAAGNVTVRSIGTATVLNTSIGVYVDGVAVTCTWRANQLVAGAVPVGGIANCDNVNTATCNSVKVTAPGGEDIYDC